MTTINASRPLDRDGYPMGGINGAAVPVEADDQGDTPRQATEGASGAAVPASKTVAEQKVGAVFQCDKFPGTDVSIRANACNEAALAARGGTIDLRSLLGGSTTGSQEIEIGSRAANNVNIGVTAIFPTTGKYTFSQVGGPIQQASLYSKSSGGSGYTANAACTVIPQETGFAYTGKATGGVITVTANGSGVITSVTATPTSAGSGYLTSKYVTVTNGGSNPCTGSGLILNIQAQDCGIRLNGSSAIESGSVGAGATTFMIRPSASNTGFVAEADLCTDQFGGYVRTDGGIKTFDGSGATYDAGTGAITGGPWLTAATTLIQDVVDQSQFNLLETSATHGNGLWIDGACCGTNFYSPHADNGNNNYTGYPIIVGSGGIIQNACYANGSTTVTAPYAHFTAKYLGFVLQPGTATSTTGFPGGTYITGINSLTSITVSQAATGPGNNTNALCTQTPLTSPVTATAGTGLTIALSDPTAPNNWAISIYNAVANDAGPGLQDMLFNYGVDGAHIYGSYEEPNSAIDEYTAINYIASQVEGVNFINPFGGASGSKYFIQADTKYNWSIFNGLIGSLAVIDQGIAKPPTTSAQPTTYIKGGLPGVVNGANLLPDTDLKQGTTYWTLPSGVSIAGGVGPLGDNGFSYTLSETSNGNIYIFAPVSIANLQANSYYTMGVWASVANATAGNLYLRLCSAVSVSSCTSLVTSSTIPYNRRINAGVYSALFSTGPNTSGYFAIEISGFKGSGKLTISEPFLVAGNIPIYQENDGGTGSNTGAGSSFSSIAINGASAGSYAKADGTGYGTPAGVATCVDSSGSGTAQSCTPSSTVSAGMCMAYSAGTSNSGASLTLNATGTAYPVAKWQGSTTALSAGDIVAGVPVIACLNYPTASQWNVESIGSAPRGAGTLAGVVAGNSMTPSGTSGSPALNAQRVAFGYCTGAATSSAKNLVLYGLGSFSTTCDSANAQASLYMPPTSGTVSDLAVSCGTSGVSGSSGVFTLYDYPNGGGGPISTGLTVIYGTTTAKNVVRDITHTHNYSAGDKFVLVYTTQANETLSNCNASFIY